jgi:hypothetical protein
MEGVLRVPAIVVVDAADPSRSLSPALRAEPIVMEPISVVPPIVIAVAVVVPVIVSVSMVLGKVIGLSCASGKSMKGPVGATSTKAQAAGLYRFVIGSGNRVTDIIE